MRCYWIALMNFIGLKRVQMMQMTNGPEWELLEDILVRVLQILILM